MGLVKRLNALPGSGKRLIALLRDREPEMRPVNA